VVGVRWLELGAPGAGVAAPVQVVPRPALVAARGAA
jgi:hypothetical protein